MLLTEGLSDYLAAFAALRAKGSDVAVVGTVSGSASAFRLARLRPDCEVYLATDPDGVGGNYSIALADALAPILLHPLPLGRIAARL